VEVRITDNGIGMDEGTRTRASDPFFTTKAVGRGSGLGLTTAHATVREHQGTLTCESTAGQGTTFTVTLPLANRGRHPESVRAASEIRGGSERILVADDERLVRETARSILQEFGYDVDVATDGREAVARLQSDPSFDLLLLDMSMPRMSGESVLQEIRTLRPGLRVVAWSGVPIELPAALEPDAALEKPIAARQLLSAVRAALDASS
jgi:CheY-like chemotaxis protein